MSAGVVVPPDGYLPGLRELCDRHGILLIFDEIITAFGRLGAMFASELFETWPDIMCLGKGLSGGYAPLSAVVISRQIAAAFWGEPRDLVQFHSGHTYGANPVACAIGIAAVDQLVREGIVGNAVVQGEQLRAGLRGLQERRPWIGDVRGLGLLVGVELVADRTTREPLPGRSRHRHPGPRRRPAARAPAAGWPLDARPGAAAHDQRGRGPRDRGNHRRRPGRGGRRAGRRWGCHGHARGRGITVTRR